MYTIQVDGRYVLDFNIARGCILYSCPGQERGKFTLSQLAQVLTQRVRDWDDREVLIETV